MHQGLVRVLRPHGISGARWKWIRPPGIGPASQANSHRRIYVDSVRLKCLDVLGRKCIRCGYDSDVRALQIDHINSDGRLDRKGPGKKSGGSYYHHIFKNLDSGRYQVLCANCNVIKRAEAQECPRKACAGASAAVAQLDRALGSEPGSSPFDSGRPRQ